MRRVVITGIGMVTPLGLSTRETWEGILAMRSGIGPITRFDPTGFKTRFAGEVKGFDPLNYMDRKTARRSDRFVQFALAAAQEALRDADLEITPQIAPRTGVIVGTGIGGIESLANGFRVLWDRGPSRVSPLLIPMMIPDMAAGQLAISFGAMGINYCPVSACATGSHALGEAMEAIARGAADVVLAGGSEAAIVPIAIASFNNAGALSTHNEDPEGACRPFDAERDGFVMGEGAAILVLEAEEHARARGARIYAELAGYGATADAYHVTLPREDGDGAVRAMRAALERAGVRPEEVDYINAHGTGTVPNDRMETKAIRQVFGAHADRLAVSSTKSMVGHLLGAAGAVEAAFCALAIHEGVIPPTRNHRTPDPECDLDYVPEGPRRRPVRVALSNSLGFGGHNAALVLRAYDEG